MGLQRAADLREHRVETTYEDDDEGRYRWECSCGHGGSGSGDGYAADIHSDRHIQDASGRRVDVHYSRSRW